MYRAFHKVWIIKCFTAREEGGRKQKAEQICSELRLEMKQRRCAKQQELQERNSHPSSGRSLGQAELWARGRLRSPEIKVGGGRGGWVWIKRWGAKFFSWFHQRNPTDINGCNWEWSQPSTARQTLRERLKTNRMVLGGWPRVYRSMGVLCQGYPIPDPDSRVFVGYLQHCPRGTDYRAGQGLHRWRLPIPTELYIPPGMHSADPWNFICEEKTDAREITARDVGVPNYRATAINSGS